MSIQFLESFSHAAVLGLREKARKPLPMDTWFNISGWFLSSLAAGGNVFVIILIVRTHRLHCSTNWLILSLAVADFGVGVVVYPWAYICDNCLYCNLNVYMAFYWFFVHSSATNLCALTWDRYTATVHPFKYPSCTTARQPARAVLLVWIGPSIISLSLLLGIYLTSSTTVLKILRLIGVSAFSITACILLLYGVTRVLIVALKKARQDSVSLSHLRPERQLDSQNDDETFRESTLPRRHKRYSTAFFLIAIVMFFLGCHVAVNYLVLCITFSCHVSHIPPRIVNCLLVINSAANPIVYAFLKPDIKAEFKKIIRRRKPRADDRTSV